MKCIKHIYTWIVKRLKSRLIFILVPLVAACSNMGEGEIAIASDDHQGITIPESLLTAALVASGTMNAYLYCDEIKHTMVISGDTAQGSCTGLSTSTLHTIRVEFEFTSSIYGGPYLLAIATKEGVGVESGGITLNFLAGDFDTSMDDDGDQISNLVELEAGADPGDAICFLGLSLIGHCTL